MKEVEILTMIIVTPCYLFLLNQVRPTKYCPASKKFYEDMLLRNCLVAIVIIGLLVIFKAFGWGIATYQSLFCLVYFSLMKYSAYVVDFIEQMEDEEEENPSRE